MKVDMARKIRQAMCLLLVLMLAPAAALAGTIDDLIGLLVHPAEQPVTMEMQAEALRIPELGETRLEWLNRLLQHISFRLTAGGDIQEEQILVDGRAAIGCTGRTEKNGTAWHFSFDGGNAYRTAEGENLLAMLAGVSAGASGTERYSEMAVLMSGFYRFFEGLPALYPENSSESKINTRYRPYGTAVKKWSVSLPDDVLQDEKMIAYLDGEGMEAVKAYLSGAVLNGRQRITLLTDEDGRLMKVNYTAKAGLSEDDMRSVNLDWRCFRREEGYKDVLTLTTPGAGSRRNNLTITQELVADPEAGETYTGSIETDQVADRIRTRILLTFDLRASDGTVTGKLLEKTTVGSVRTSTEVLADIQKDEQEEYRGSLEIITKSDKIEKEHYRLHVTAGKSEMPAWNEMPVRQPDEAAREQIAGKAARAFLKALIPLPESDLQYILADLPEGWWAQMTSKIEDSEETEQP